MEKEIVIRDYKAQDEQGWLRCRVLSFLDCSYYNDVLTKREVYENDAICLVAIDRNSIIGLIDVELEKEANSLCVTGMEKGAVIWHLAVLQEYRRRGIAKMLIEEAEKRLLQKDCHYCEVWTQEDEAANKLYVSQGFENVVNQNWIRCYARPSKADWFLNRENVGEIYGVEEMIFEISPDRMDEVREYCYRMDEVRLYAKRFS